MGSINWTKRDIVRTTYAIIGSLIVLGTLRFLVFDYPPPESLIRILERSAIVTTGMRKLALVGYGTVAIIMMAVLFKIVQERWPGRGVLKGLAFGVAFGVVWSFGFLTGWAFLGTTLRAELSNSVVDLIALSVAGWLIGIAIGRDVSGTTNEMSRPYLAVALVAAGFVLVHALGTKLLANVFPRTADLLLVPTTLTQLALLLGLGVSVGGMYVMLRAGLPFESTWARVAFFAFGFFGLSWTWFHLFFVIEFSGVVPTVLLVGLIGSGGVYAGALAYEALAQRALALKI